MTKYTEQDMLKLVDECEIEFKKHLAKAEESAGVKELAKAEDKEDVKVEDKKAEDKKDEKPADKEDKKDDDSLDYDDEDFEMMKSLYHSMSKAELTAHHVTAKRLMEDKGFAKAEEMTKSEDASLELAKSEILTLKKENDDLKKNVDKINEFLTLLNKKSAPKQKAITSMDYVKKSEESEKVLTKTEIHNILLTKSQNPSLSLADREAINAYYTSNASVDSIKHLLK
jgi:hypothetical protein